MALAVGSAGSRAVAADSSTGLKNEMHAAYASIEQLLPLTLDPKTWADPARRATIQKQLAEQREAIASGRRAQVGSGMRSEKVRTYNFPQGRLTDHRIKLTSHDLDGVLGGDLSGFTDALAAEERRLLLEAEIEAG